MPGEVDDHSASEPLCLPGEHLACHPEWPIRSPSVEAMDRHSIRIWVGGRNRIARREVEERAKVMARPPQGPLDIAVITPESVEEAGYFAKKVLDRLEGDGEIWIVCPRRKSDQPPASAVPGSDLDDAMAELSLNETERVAIGPDHLAVRFNRRIA